MDAPDNAGSKPSSYELLLDLDIWGDGFADDLSRFSYTRAETFTVLLRQIAKGDQPLYRALLRRWGIW